MAELTPHAAIEALRAEVLRCFDCGRAHKYWLNPVPDWPNLWTWADPDDGHTYRHMSGDQALDWLFTDAAEAVLESDARRNAVACGDAAECEEIAATLELSSQNFDRLTALLLCKRCRAKWETPDD